jgi:nardilysin
MTSVREEHKLQATFQFPPLDAEYRKKAEDYVSHLIGHEARGSLLSALKARGWATELCAGVSDQTSAAWLFDVCITLTEAGLAAGASGCGLEPLALLFDYLAMLRSAGPQRWVHDEMAAIAAMKFRFLEEEDPSEYVSQLATDMHNYPQEHVVAGAFLYDEYDPELASVFFFFFCSSCF